MVLVERRKPRSVPRAASPCLTQDLPCLTQESAPASGRQDGTGRQRPDGLRGPLVRTGCNLFSVLQVPAKPRKRGRGRPAIFGQAMSAAERKRRSRRRAESLAMADLALKTKAPKGLSA
jgi:hypothetical protein